jgi:hypothetical protein
MIRDRKKIIAILLSVIFLFVYTEKIFHSHSKIHVPDPLHCSISGTSTCQICDFQAAKDAVIPQITVACSPFLPLFNLPVFPAESLSPGIERYENERGPPFADC